MIQTLGYAVDGPTADFANFDFARRDVGENDILIEISYCGVCHSDIHQVRDEWGGSIYPMVPGHEIVGRVTAVGANVTKVKAGDFAGVGCMVDSCRTCVNCKNDEEQFCEVHCSFTYNSTEQDQSTPTQGGYSDSIVTDEAFVLTIDESQPLEKVAPLLCAGITTYSPLRRFGIKEGSKVGIVGLGGLGHMGVKLAASMGAEVTVFSTSPEKEKDARELGAHNFVISKNKAEMDALGEQFDFILDCVAADHDLNAYLQLLKLNGALVLVGIPGKPAEVLAPLLVSKHRTLTGSAIGGIKETQEMLDYCAAHNITSDVEVIPIQDVNAAYERTIKGDVHYRFVIDMASLKNS